MNKPISQSERELIQDLLRSGERPQEVAQIVGRGSRIVFYIQAEMRHRPARKSYLQRLWSALKGEQSEERETYTRRVGQNRGQEI